MKWKRWSSLALVAFLGTGCFHQIVNTGLAAGPTVVDKPWDPGWLWGLIANDEVDVRKECPMGVATVVTEMSFVNGLAALVTIGIFTPQHVTVTCASRSASLPAGIRELTIPVGASKEAELAIVRQAIRESAETHAPAALRF
jgi:Bor protein